MNKKFYQSKTLWAAMLLPLVALLLPKAAPNVEAWATTNPEAFMFILTTVLSAVFGLLRTVTKGKLDFGITDESITSDLPKRQIGL